MLAVCVEARQQVCCAASMRLAVACASAIGIAGMGGYWAAAAVDMDDRYGGSWGHLASLGLPRGFQGAGMPLFLGGLCLLRSDWAPSCGGIRIADLALGVPGGTGG